MSSNERGGRWHRFMMSIMGPAQVGPYDSAAPAADTSTCPRCSQGWDTHETVRTPTRSYLRCRETGPEDGAATGPGGGAA